MTARLRFFGGSPDDVIDDIVHCHDLTGCAHISVGFGGGLSGRPEAASSFEAARLVSLTLAKRSHPSVAMS